VLFGMARDSGLAAAGVEFMEALEATVGDAVKPLPINIDGALAAVLHDMGFPPEFGRLLFLIGRVAGLSAEVSEELARERPMRIRIPVEYDGEPPRSLT
jgi:citrate synthase